MRYHGNLAWTTEYDGTSNLDSTTRRVVFHSSERNRLSQRFRLLLNNIYWEINFLLSAQMTFLFLGRVFLASRRLRRSTDHQEDHSWAISPRVQDIYKPSNCDRTLSARSRNGSSGQKSCESSTNFGQHNIVQIRVTQIEHYKVYSWSCEDYHTITNPPQIRSSFHQDESTWKISARLYRR